MVSIKDRVVTITAPPPRRLRPVWSRHQTMRRHRYTVLVVEDDDLFRDTTKLMLRDHFTVKLAIDEKNMDALVAKKRIDLSKIDLAIIDIHLGGVRSMDYRGLKRARDLAKRHRIIIRSSPSLRWLQNSVETPEDLRLWLNKLPPWVTYVGKYETNLLVPKIRELLGVEVGNLPEPEPEPEPEAIPPSSIEAVQPYKGEVETKSKASSDRQMLHLSVTLGISLLFGVIAIVISDVGWLVGSVVSAMVAVPLLREERLPTTISGWGVRLREHLPLLALLSAYGAVLLSLAANEAMLLIMAGVLALMSPFSVILVKGLEYSDQPIVNNQQKQVRMRLAFAGVIVSQLLLLGTGLITLATADSKWFVSTLLAAVFALLFSGVCVEWLEETIDELYHRAWRKLRTNHES